MWTNPKQTLLMKQLTERQHIKSRENYLLLKQTPL